MALGFREVSPLWGEHGRAADSMADRKLRDRKVPAH